MDNATFAKSYGEVIKVISSLVKYVVDKEYLGTDGKFGVDDIGSIITQVMPALMLVDDFKILVENGKMFLEPEVIPLLQTEFDSNFDLTNDKVEMITEEIHGIVLNIIRIVVKFTRLSDEEPVA